MGKFARKVIKNSSANRLVMGIIKVVEKHDLQLAALDKYIELLVEQKLVEKGILTQVEVTEMAEKAVSKPELERSEKKQNES